MVDLVLLAGGLALFPWTTGGDSIYAEDVVAALVFTLVGGLLASRLPDNPLGWLFLAGGTGGAVAIAGDHYVEAAYFGGLALPGAELVLRTTLGAWIAPFAVLPFLLVLFPDGRPPSRRWRDLLLVASAAVAFLVALLLVTGLAAPVDELLSDDPPSSGVFALVLGAHGVLLGCIVLAIGAPFLRWRRASGVERQQLRWFAVGAVVSAIGTIGTLFVDGNLLSEALGAVGMGALPAGIAVAVLHYRLYDLGRLVNRSIVYGALTGVLALAYLGGVTLLRGVLPFTGESQLAVAGSTLAVAALAAPLRRRIQRAVDRRFDRRRYDARRTAESFRASLRNELDLDMLNAELLSTVRRTVSPVTASLWLRSRP